MTDERAERTIGIVSATMDELREAHRPEWVREGYAPDTVRGNIMTQKELQSYYDKQTRAARESVELLEQEMPPRAREFIEDVINIFRTDLPFLQTKGIDTEEAEALLKQWNKG